jgi:hypothetical protein
MPFYIIGRGSRVEKGGLKIHGYSVLEEKKIGSVDILEPASTAPVPKSSKTVQKG